MNAMDRRHFLQSSALGLSALAVGATSARSALAGKKVLFFTKSSGFEHSVIKLGPKGEPSHADKIFTEIGEKLGLQVTCSKDGRLFEPDAIGEWDAFAFETTGDLTKTGTDKQPAMSAKGEAALYEAIASGKGFMGMHCATDTFGHHRGKGKDDPFIAMIGGEFISHGPQQVSKLRIHDAKFPGAAAFGDKEFSINDEWYSLINLADDLHVIYSQVTEGMNGWEYVRPDFPQTWSRQHGKGRVFYTSMGHREDVWANENYKTLLAGGLKFVLGQAEGSTEPNVKTVLPGYDVVPKRPEKKA
jgi:type 1 glutamine amidotransferase